MVLVDDVGGNDYDDDGNNEQAIIDARNAHRSPLHVIRVVRHTGILAHPRYLLLHPLHAHDAKTDTVRISLPAFISLPFINLPFFLPSMLLLIIIIT